MKRLKKTSVTCFTCITCVCSALLAATAGAQPSKPGEQAAWHVANRFGYGVAPAQLGELAALKTQADAKTWATEQLAQAKAASAQAAPVNDNNRVIAMPIAELGAKLAAAQAQQADRRQARAVSATPLMGDDGMPAAMPAAPPIARLDDLERLRREMAQAAMGWRLQACTNAQFEHPMLAKLTEFWFNHFNVSLQKPQTRPFVGHYLTGAIRPNVLGKFEDLVLATAKHPAMLFYLDQNNSMAEGLPAGVLGRRSGLNENYARELMELHTLGVNSGYTQQDVRELARILTGWTSGLQDGTGFRFAPNRHDKSAKTLLGVEFKQGGLAEGEAALRMLARHPATAQRVALRLSQWFVADAPPTALVQRLAAQFTDTQGDLMAVTQALMESPEFWAAGQQLVKTPQDYACSVVTAAGGLKSPREAQLILGFLDNSGQPLFRWQTPDGYKVDAATWLAPEALTRRADFAIAFAQQRGGAWPVLDVAASAKTAARVAQEPEAQRAGLVLASPEFMRK